MPEVNETVEDDHMRLALLAGSAAVFLFCWRIGVLVNDSYVFINTLISLRNGQLHFTEQIVELMYRGLIPAQPGLHVVDGSIYGRNYGQAFLALPVLLVVEGVTLFLNPMIIVAAVWSGLISMCISEICKINGCPQTISDAGKAVAIVLFGVNLWLLKPITIEWSPYIALQLTSIIVATATVGLLYQIGRSMASKRVGLLMGTFATLASPVAFWAPLSKRHTLTGFLALAALYGLYRSRVATSSRTAVQYRVTAYVSVGLTAWIHSIEGLLLALTLIPIDLVTTRTTLVRSTGVMTLTLMVAFLPFFITNFLISGNLVRPPRALPSTTTSNITAPVESNGSAVGVYGQEEAVTQPEAAQAGSDATGTLIDSLAAGAGERLSTFLSYIGRNIITLTQPERWYTTFVRNSYGFLSSHQFTVPAQDFAVLESMPIAGAIIGGLALVGYRAVQDSWDAHKLLRNDPRRIADAFVILHAAWLIIIYVPRLPLHTTYTVRYLYPLYLYGIYAVARIEFVQQTVHMAWRRLLIYYLLTILLGGAALVGLLAVLDSNPSGFNRHMDMYTAAFQVHALAGALSGLLVGAWSIYAAMKTISGRVGAIVLGNAAGITTLYILFASLRYFAFTSQYAIPLSRVLARLLGAV